MDVDSENAKTLAREYNIPSWTGNYEDVLADKEVDWLDISTPNSTHAALTIQALRTGKHVLIQKPMATSVEEAEKMLEAAREAKKSLSVYMCFRGDPGVHAIRELILSGVLGGIISIRGAMISAGGFSLRKGWRQQEGSGALEQLGTHMIDLFAFLTGSIEWVNAEMNTLYAPMEGDDVTFALLGLGLGLTGIMETTYCSFVSAHTPMYVLEVNGTQGTIRYQLETGQMTVQMKEDAEIGPYSYKAGSGVSHFQFEHTLGGGAVHHAHQQFIDKLTDDQPDYSGAVQGIRTLQVIRAIRESAAAGRKVHIDPYH
jgi:predicted dehydrogenase